MATRLPIWKTTLMITGLMMSFCYTSAQNIWWIATTDEAWGNGANWSTVSATGPACNCVPDVNSHVIFTSQGPGNCRFDVSPNIKSVETNLYVGTIDLNGNNWNIAGTGGDVSELGAGVTIVNTGAPATLDIRHDSNDAIFRFGAITIDANVNVACTAWKVLIEDAVFNGSTVFVATGNDLINGSGRVSGATFNGPADFTITQASFFFSPNVPHTTFNNTLALNNLSQLPSSELISLANADVNGDVTFFIDANFSQSIQLDNVTLAAGASISSLPGAKGMLFVANSTLDGTVDIDMADDNAQVLILNSTFSDDLTVVTGSVNVESSTFRGTTSLTLNGSNGSITYGSNFFEGATSMTLSDHAGAFQFGIFPFSEDHFNGPLTITNLSTIGSSVVLGADSDVTFATDVTFNSTGPVSPIIVGTSGHTTTYNGNVNFNTETIVSHNGTVVFSAASDQTISNTFSSIPPAFVSVTVNKPAGELILSPGAAISVYDVFTFTDGIVSTTATSPVQFMNGSSVAGTPGDNSHIDGPVSKEGEDPFTFPVGNNGIYGPIGITPTANVTVLAQFLRSSPFPGLGTDKGTGLEHLSGCEHWTLDRTSGTQDVGVTLSWTTANCPPTTMDYIGVLNDLRVTQWDNVNAEWTDLGNSGTTGDENSGTVTSSLSLSGSGVFTLGSSSDYNTLPIILLDFTGTSGDAGVTLQWRTETEINNDYFEIEHAGADFVFHTIGQVAGAGTSENIVTYNFVHPMPTPGGNYYRLKQVDWNGDYTYSSIIVVEFFGNKVLQMRPNPAAQHDVVQFNKKVYGQVVNNMGTVVLELHDVDHLNASQIPPGIYIIRCASGESSKLIVR